MHGCSGFREEKGGGISLTWSAGSARENEQQHERGESSARRSHLPLLQESRGVSTGRGCNVASILAKYLCGDLRFDLQAKLLHNSFGDVTGTFQCVVNFMTNWIGDPRRSIFTPLDRGSSGSSFSVSPAWQGSASSWLSRSLARSPPRPTRFRTAKISPGDLWPALLLSVLRLAAQTFTSEG